MGKLAMVAFAAGLLGCSLVVRNKLDEKGAQDGSPPPGELGAGGEHRPGAEPGPFALQIDGEQPGNPGTFVIGERLTLSGGSTLLAKKVGLEGGGQKLVVPVQPAGLVKRTFTIPPLAPDGAVKLTLMNEAGAPLAGDQPTIKIERLLVMAFPQLAQLHLYSSLTLQKLGTIELGAGASPPEPLLSPSGRYLAVEGAGAPRLIDLVLRKVVSLPLGFVSANGLSAHAFQPAGRLGDVGGVKVFLYEPEKSLSVIDQKGLLFKIDIAQAIQGSVKPIADGMTGLRQVVWAPTTTPGQEISGSLAAITPTALQVRLASGSVATLPAPPEAECFQLAATSPSAFATTSAAFTVLLRPTQPAAPERLMGATAEGIVIPPYDLQKISSPTPGLSAIGDLPGTSWLAALFANWPLAGQLVLLGVRPAPSGALFSTDQFSYPEVFAGPLMILPAARYRQQVLVLSPVSTAAPAKWRVSVFDLAKKGSIFVEPSAAGIPSVTVVRHHPYRQRVFVVAGSVLSIMPYDGSAPQAPTTLTATQPMLQIQP